MTDIETMIPNITLDDMAKDANDLIPCLEKAKSVSWGKDYWDKYGFKHFRRLGPYMFVGDMGSYDDRIRSATVPSSVWVAIRTERDDIQQEHAQWALLGAERLNKLPRGIFPIAEGHAYQGCITWKYKDGWFNYQFFMTISDSGVISACNYTATITNTFKSKKRWLTLRSKKTLNYKDHFGSMLEADKGKPPEHDDELNRLTTLAFNIWNGREYCWNVEFSSPKARITFGIDIYNAKKMFKDRQERLTKTGRRKPIVHWVTSHYRKKSLRVRITKFIQQRHLWAHPILLWRKLAKPSTVKTHIKGSKNFMVGDYEVSIFTDDILMLSKTWSIRSVDNDCKNPTMNEMLESSEYYTSEVA